MRAKHVPLRVRLDARREGPVALETPKEQVGEPTASNLSSHPEVNVFLADITGALLRWTLLAVLALRVLAVLHRIKLYFPKLIFISVRLFSKRVALSTLPYNAKAAVAFARVCR